jgi:diadenosine tetraphosphatase ApaH/serine/threonine PP2A family protein phosphatase
VRRFGATLVVNVGSVGSPFDRDPRTSYGRLTYRGGGWKAEIRRLDYDRERAERDFADSGFIEVGGPLVRLMQAELAQSRGHMGPWTARYQRAVLERHITVAEAVEEYLASL